jgi:predicted O-methyltransferase YrrM
VRRSKTAFLPAPARAVVGRAASRVQNTGRALRWLLKPPTQAAHIEWTVLVDAQEDERHPAGGELVRLALEAAQRATRLHLPDVAARCRDEGAKRLVELWPGEHYRFLAALVETIRPQLVVEVGTFTGMGSLSMASALAAGGRLITFDVVPWTSFPDTLLRDEDSSVIEQRLCDLSDETAFAEHSDLFAEADLVFLDGPKDGHFEPVLHRLLTGTVKASALVVYDDIRLLTMVELWRSIATPKYDATSLGHWTGTGLVRYG